MEGTIAKLISEGKKSGNYRPYSKVIRRTRGTNETRAIEEKCDFEILGISAKENLKMKMVSNKSKNINSELLKQLESLNQK